MNTQSKITMQQKRKNSNRETVRVNGEKIPVRDDGVASNVDLAGAAVVCVGALGALAVIVGSAAVAVCNLIF